ncbi:vomeronasal type-2 receptor 116-like [Rana temporaria]|uniref:vomeronasal type-2 receptor 116-like n=1 Tax=Rana temporaria TaxID=8407 RepID=UPI001AAD6DF2|nr:vomeronasal type-2 receptor 116-like [Rana temporaria]
MTRKDDNPNNWSPDSIKAFESLKFAFVSAPVMAHLDPTLPFILEVDASETGISYGAPHTALTNRRLYPSFFHTLPSDHIQFLAVVKLLKHFGWTWIGVIASDDDYGDSQSQELILSAASHDICIEFIIKIPTHLDDRNVIYKKKEILNNSSSQVIVLCGKSSYFIKYFIEVECKAQSKTFIVPATWTLHRFFQPHKTPYHGSLLFKPPKKSIPRLKEHLKNVTSADCTKDFLLEQILTDYYHCLTSNSYFNRRYEKTYKVKLHKCNAIPDFEKYILDFGTTYHVYKAVYALAQSLHNIDFYLSRNARGTFMKNQKLMKELLGERGCRLAPHGWNESLGSVQKMRRITGVQQQNPMGSPCSVAGSDALNASKVQNYGQLPLQEQFLRRVHLQDPTGEEVYFNERGDMCTVYHVNSFGIHFDSTLVFVHIGSYNTSSPDGEELVFDELPPTWKHGEIPVSMCSDDCPLGFRRVMKRGIHRCCFECIQCPEGEISNDTDKASCQKCSEEEWPNDNNQCVPKLVEFLSYGNDPAPLTVSVISVFLFIKTSAIFCVFIVFRETPVVRANNKNLSFILLVSIMLSFLCVFLFLGRPGPISCMFRQTSFGIIFSVAVSSILAKTIMVYMAFKATKPGSFWRKYIGVKLPNCLVFLCSFIQVLISIIWLLTACPYPETNTDLYADKIIIQCNEGSMLAFSILLGYMGLLAAVSFFVAFLARNLPDNYNEAKYITFSMLVFCSVWIAFIPAYMSVTGKNTVLVEIFAIIASSLGIVGCIFIPKCYIILVRPDLNSKGKLVKQTKT